MLCGTLESQKVSPPVKADRWGRRQRPARKLTLCGDSSDQRLDVSEGERKTLIAGDSVNARDMIRHHHAVVADFLVDTHRLQHVDTAVVDEGFAEIQEAAFDVAEVNAEDLLAR